MWWTCWFKIRLFPSCFGLVYENHLVVFWFCTHQVLASLLFKMVILTINWECRNVVIISLLKLINDTSSDKPIVCPHLGHMDIPRYRGKERHVWISKDVCLEVKYTEFLLARFLPSPENLNDPLVLVLCTLKLGLYKQRIFFSLFWAVKIAKRHP